jgi:hypothetical protein
MHDRYGPRVASRLIVGLSIALVGLLLLFDEMGVLRARHLLRYWPVLLVIIGLARILSPWSGHSRFFGFLLVVFGGWLLLDRLGYVYFEWQYLWPALLVLFGLRLALAGSVYRGRRWQRPRRGSAAAEDARGGPTGAFGSADAEIDALAVLGSVVRASTAQGFHGGNAIAVLGSCRIDLRRATLDGEALIEVLPSWAGSLSWYRKAGPSSSTACRSWEGSRTRRSPPSAARRSAWWSAASPSWAASR